MDNQPDADGLSFLITLKKIILDKYVYYHKCEN